MVKGIFWKCQSLWLSQWTIGISMLFSNSMTNTFSHTASVKAIYLDSIVDRATTDCRDDFQLIVFPKSENVPSSRPSSIQICCKISIYKTFQIFWIIPFIFLDQTMTQTSFNICDYPFCGFPMRFTWVAHKSVDTAYCMSNIRPLCMSYYTSSCPLHWSMVFFSFLMSLPQSLKWWARGTVTVLAFSKLYLFTSFSR